MKKKIDINSWIRKEHFNFFSKFDEPFHGIVADVDCTIAYEEAKKKSQSFFLYYLYRAIKAMNSLENFRLRVEDGEVYLYDKIHVSTTVLRSDNTFGFAFIDFDEDENEFLQHAKPSIDRVHTSKGLDLGGARVNEVHCSALPWLNFTSLSHARNFKYEDSCPKISFAKLIDVDGKKKMRISIHAHHGLIDGYHVAQFFDEFQILLDEKD